MNAQAPNVLFAWHASLVHGVALIEAGRFRHGRRELLAVAGGFERRPMFPTTMPYFFRHLVDGESRSGASTPPNRPHVRSRTSSLRCRCCPDRARRRGQR
ncbi:hypothetical protein ABZV91_13970 [Nocardia sp. NPDC004568]|uniref:hypothetical protein n=1 Tax=Nocardia sp. NPDC004568 TaxID=3154551 RepID=UPI0033BC5D4A